ncbi:hypothetical protein [Glycomyces albidus]|uniref:Uncharacterized protein n=1 Tax=Glycomyces albidus TaxID=2656774 RepID=A0A6L5G9W0_9ACTN|nr:hypothetical protein [Glycomyces albidus]MQM26465.1 hypothetical protein [Glycomyces albidus]
MRHNRVVAGAAARGAVVRGTVVQGTVVHGIVVERREHRRAFRRAFLTAAVATALAAALGYAVAFSPLAGWATLGVAAAGAVSLWLESRADRAATPPPVAFVTAPGDD